MQEKALGKKFELESGDLESGAFSMEALLGGTKKRPETVTLYSNLTKRAYVKTRDPRYEELKDQLPGYVPRYPELPPASYLFHAWSEGHDKLRKVCEKAGIEIHSLPEYLSDENNSR